MGQSTLIAYSTIDGHTLHICERLSLVLKAFGHDIVLKTVDEAMADTMARYDRIVVGASIRYGHHRPAVQAFIARHLQALRSRPSAFFSVNVVARKPNKNTPQTNPYARAFLRRIAWRPALAAVFAGRIDYPRYGWLDRTMIRLIMAITHGPTDPRGTFEFTDWDAVDAFARAFAALPAPGVQSLESSS
ncbi:MAG: menaquinone-dependent protoporphyrinogen IX dehydrogenase [Rhodoferax sp.]